jgi:CTP synthase
MEEKGLLLSGKLENNQIAEIAEVKGHPWMVGVQFHPEFKSKPTDPHPLFKAFVGAMISHKDKSV